MTMPTPKYACFGIKSIKDSWIVVDPELKLGDGEDLPNTDPVGCLTYNYNFSLDKN